MLKGILIRRGLGPDIAIKFLPNLTQSLRRLQSRVVVNSRQFSTLKAPELAGISKLEVTTLLVQD